MLVSLLVVLPIVAALVNAGVGLYAMRFRAVPAARTFALVLFLVAFWGVAYGCELAAPGMAGKLLWLKLRGALFLTPPLWLVMCLQLTGKDKWLRPWHIVLLCLLPAVTALLQLTTEHTGLVRQNLQISTSGPLPLLTFTNGPLFLALGAYTPLVMLASLAVLGSSYRRAHDVARSQLALVFAGGLLSMASDIVFAHGLSPMPGYNFTPTVFIITGGLVGLALFRYGMFSIVPIARGLIIENMRSAVLVVDTEHRVVCANKAAERLPGRDAAALVGASATLVGSEWPDLLARYWDVEEASEVVALPSGDEERLYDLSITPLRDSRGLLLGRLLTLHDITELKRAQSAAEDALANVRTLSGLLPICASCKMIRDDQGYWQAVEHYVSEHTDAEFTHGLCPECSAQYFDKARTQLARPGKTDEASGEAQAGT